LTKGLYVFSGETHLDLLIDSGFRIK
jgi:hypothetical protein